MQRKNDSRVGETIEVIIDEFEGIEDTEFSGLIGNKNIIEDFATENPNTSFEQLQERLDTLNALNDENIKELYEIFNSESRNTDNLTFNQFKTMIELICKENNSLKSLKKTTGTTNKKDNKKSISYLYSGRSYGEAPEIDPVIVFFSFTELNIGDYVSVKILTDGHGQLVGIVQE
jgi:hypothetical protein